MDVRLEIEDGDPLWLSDSTWTVLALIQKVHEGIP